MNTLSKPLIPPAKCSSSRRVLDSSCFPTGNWISGSWIRFGFSGRLDNKNFSFKLTTVLQGRIGLKTRFLSLGYWFQLVKLYYGFHEQLDLRVWSLSLGYWFQLTKLTTVFHEQLDLRIWSLSLGYWFIQFS